MSRDTTDCTSPELEVLLSDYYTGHLPAHQTALVKGHLKDCRPCRQSLRMMAAISAKHPPPEVNEIERHYSPQLLGRFYSNPRSLDAELVHRIEEHVGSCSECAADLQFLQDSDKDLRLSISNQPSSTAKRSLLDWLWNLLGIKRTSSRRHS